MADANVLLAAARAFADAVAAKSAPALPASAEDQLRGPFENLLASVAAEFGIDVACTGEATLPDRTVAGPTSYGLIVNIRYVNLSLLHTLTDRLRPGGALLVEQHLAPAEGSFLRGAGPSRSPAEGSGPTIVGPRNPAFRVAPGSLRRLAHGLLVRRSRKGLVREPDGTLAALAQLVAFAPAAERDGCNRPTPAYDAPP